MRINEIFDSIQGEGPWTGKRCVFVRASGCNHSCEFCDTKSAQRMGVEVNSDEIVGVILKSNAMNVVFTGGEPSLQINEIEHIIRQVKQVCPEKKISIETNGSIKFDPTLFDLVCVSPKIPSDYTGWFSKDELPYENVIIKIVVSPKNVDTVMKDLVGYKFNNVYLMPLGTTPVEIIEGTKVIAMKLREYDIKASLSTRLHVLINER